MVRLFVALALPEILRTQLNRLQTGLKGARWVDEESLHVTVRFIGEVEEGLAREIDEALLDVTAPPFRLTLENLGLFGTGHRQRTLWAGIRKHPDLTLLKGRVDTALQGIGVARESRAFHPHVTLARLDRVEPDNLQAFVEAHNLSVSGAFAVEDFRLYSSILTRHGPHYTEEAVYPLDPV